VIRDGHVAGILSTEKTRADNSEYTQYNPVCATLLHRYNVSRHFYPGSRRSYFWTNTYLYSNADIKVPHHLAALCHTAVLALREEGVQFAHGILLHIWQDVWVDIMACSSQTT